MRFVHPEATAEETWIGNMFPCDYPQVGWKTKRKGKVPYGSDGKVLKGGGFCPVFVSLAELRAAGVEIPDEGPIDHKW